MNKWNKEIIDKLADKLLIGLTDEENKMIVEDFDAIEDDIELINKIPKISEVEPLTHPFPLEDIFLNDDEVYVSLTTEEIFCNCKDVFNGEIKLPKVVGELNE